MVLTSLPQRDRRRHQPAVRVRAADHCEGYQDVLRRTSGQPVAGAAQLADRQHRCRRSWCCCWPSRRPTPCRSGRCRSGPTCCSSSCPPRCCRSWPGCCRSTSSRRTCDLLDNIWLLIILYTVDEPADRGVDAALVPGRGAGRDARGGPGRRRQPASGPCARSSPRSSTPGIAAAALICFIFSWNELLFARVLTGDGAETAPVFLTGFVTSQGLFLAKVCAAVARGVAAGARSPGSRPRTSSSRASRSARSSDRQA